MARYSKERKAAVLEKLLAPSSESVAKVAAEEEIPEQTLYHWRKQARQNGAVAPGSTANAEDWDGQSKLAVVVKTAGMNGEELGRYCRSKGLYPEQVERWRKACIVGVAGNPPKRSKEDRKTIKRLQTDLRRKDRALAESAALLVLQKKFRALWEDEAR